MPMPVKNTPFSPAAAALGLGDMLMQQVDDQELERKRKMQQSAPMNTLLGGAAQSLFGTGGMQGV